MDLEANDEQLDFPILYGIARQGIVVYDPDDVKGISVEEGDAKIKKSAKGMQGLDVTPLFDTIIKHTQPYPDRNAEPLQLQISALGYDDYIGRLGIGRITKGVIKAGSTVAVAKGDGQIEQKKINQVFVYRGLKRMAVDQRGSRRHCRDLRYCGHLHRRDASATRTAPAAAGNDPHRRADSVDVFHGQQVAVRRTSPANIVTSRHIRERLQ